jgi:bifunctional non-homologous end joining protein LigD
VKLDEYKKKRDAGRTNEPMGEVPERAGPTTFGAYVVHQHDATRMHYDLRLEIGGVLASFAIPRGPTTDPDARHLAVHTEDHPLEYLDFEDVIPDGLYGAGPMICWDRGSVRFLETSAEEGLQKGKLDFVLSGYKLHGRYGLVKIKKAEKEWLLLKKRDAFSDPKRDIVTELPRSILSGLTIEELPRASAIAEQIARKARGEATDVDVRSAPAWTVTRAQVSGAYEIALDGARVIARDGAIWFEGSDVSAFYPDVLRALKTMPGAVFEGTIVAFDEAGQPSIPRLSRRLELVRGGDVHRGIVEVPVVLMVSDLLALAGKDIRGTPFEERKAILRKLVPASGLLRVLDDFEGDPAPLLAFARQNKLEGVIARKDGELFLMPTPREGIPKLAAHTAPKAKRAVTVSNREKIFWPEDGYTKGDLCAYYEAIAPAILPYLEDRPIVLVRYPDGIHNKNFYQWNVPPGMPSWITSLQLKADEDGQKRVFVVNDALSLLYLANLAVIPIHVLGCRAQSLEACDFFTLDFDVKLLGLEAGVELAHTLKDLLAKVGLTGYPKTSGQTGLHVLVPLGPGQSFDTARALADLFGRLLVQRHPKIATMERVVGRRGKRVYVDTGQTGRARTIVCPYSVRATLRAQVSAPLAWSEVTEELDPSAFTIKTMPERFARAGDPMSGMLAATPDVARAVSELAALL